MALRSQLTNVEYYQKALKVHRRNVPKCERSLAEAQVAVSSAVHTLQPHIESNQAIVIILLSASDISPRNRFWHSCQTYAGDNCKPGNAGAAVYTQGSAIFWAQGGVSAGETAR